MTGRFEVLSLNEAQCLIRFRDANDQVLLASTPIAGVDLAERTIEWLRTALHKDWLYQIGRAYQGNGPMFSLSAPFGVVCSSPPFTSSDAMERTIAYIKAALPHAPVRHLTAEREARTDAPAQAAASPVPQRIPAAGVRKKPATRPGVAASARSAPRDG